MPRAFLIALLSCLFAAAQPGSTDADPLKRGRKYVQDLRYDDAERELKKALRKGKSDVSTLAEIYFLRGLVAASLDDVETAKKRFAAAVSLLPSFVLPPGLSPKITEPFNEAKKETAALEASPSLEGTRLAIQISADPAKLVASARVVFVGEEEGRTLEKKGTTSFLFQLPPSASVAVELLDRWGNLVLVLATQEEPLSSAGTVDTESIPPPSSKSLVRRWWLWGGSAAVVAGVGGFFAFKTKSAQDDYDDLAASGMATFSQLESVEDDGKRYALLSNITFGVAGSLAIVSAVMLALDLSEDSDSPAEQAQIAPVVSRGGASLRATFRF